ncbi:hypothetical protein GCM10025734_61650 [Kitasatospora paranensis]
MDAAIADGGGPAAAADALPPGAAPFAGRRAELAALGAAARAARHAPEDRGRLVVLAGRPGSGRTSLAVHHARTLAAEYPDGLLYVRLSAPDGGRVTAGRAARELLRQLGAVPPGLLPPADTADTEDPACAALREALAGRRALLLLDDVRDAAQLRPLLGVGASCLLLAVTAGPLTGIDKVDPVILGGLDQTSAVRLLGELVGGTRVAADPVGAAELAEACAARPAALRLMADRLRGNARAAVTDAAGELAAATGRAAAGTAKPADTRADTRPAGRDGGRDGAQDAVPAEAGPDSADGPRKGTGNPGERSGTAPGKGRKQAQRAAEPTAAAAPGRPAAAPQPGDDGPLPLPEGEPLLGAFDLVYRALPAAQARMLRMLTLAPAQLADLRTASALVGCPAPEAAQQLAALAGHELLGTEREAGDGTARYRLPGRFHARLVELRTESDRPAEVELARARLVERLVRMVESALALLAPGDGPRPDPLPGPLRLRTAAHAAQWLAEEREQLLTAVGDAIGRGDLDGSSGRLVAALLRALPLCGDALPSDLHRLHVLVLAVAERAGDPRRAAAALLRLGDLQAGAGRWDEAAERYRAAVERAREAGDELGCARALESAAGCYRALGDPLRAGDGYGRALALRQGLGDAAGEARLLARVAEAHTAQRRFEEALREYRAALGMLRRLGDSRGESLVGQALERLQQQLEGEWNHPFAE